MLRFLDGADADLYPYEAAIEREIMADIRAAKLLRDAYHYKPWPCYFMLRRSDRFKVMLCQLITGEHSYASYMRQLGPLGHVLRFWAARGRRSRPGPARQS